MHFKTSSAKWWPFCFTLYSYVSGTTRIKPVCNFNQNMIISIRPNGFENVFFKMAAILSRPQYVKSMLVLFHFHLFSLIFIFIVCIYVPLYILVIFEQYRFRIRMLSPYDFEVYSIPPLSQGLFWVRAQPMKGSLSCKAFSDWPNPYPERSLLSLGMFNCGEISGKLFRIRGTLCK